MFTIKIENGLIHFVKPNKLGNLSHKLKLSDLGNVYIENYTGRKGKESAFLYMNRKQRRQYAFNLDYDKATMSHIYDMLQHYFIIMVDDDNLSLVKRD